MSGTKPGPDENEPHGRQPHPGEQQAAHDVGRMVDASVKAGEERVGV